MSKHDAMILRSCGFPVEKMSPLDIKNGAAMFRKIPSLHGRNMTAGKRRAIAVRVGWDKFCKKYGVRNELS